MKLKKLSYLINFQTQNILKSFHCYKKNKTYLIFSYSIQSIKSLFLSGSSEKFEHVSFEGEVVPVKQKLEVFQDCTKPKGIEGIFKSFNEQFAAK